MRVLQILIIICITHTPLFADELIDRIPTEIQPFAENGQTIRDWKTADLNGDGQNDYLVILETPPATTAEPDTSDPRKRTLIIIERQKDNTLKRVKQNARIIACSTCGGQEGGDGYSGLKAGNRTFSIQNNSTVTAYQSTQTYTFGYSRQDHTWQLVSVETTQQETSDPESEALKYIETAPDNFGKIDIADFDRNDYWHQGTGTHNVEASN